MTDMTFTAPAARQTKLSVLGVIGTTLRTFAKAPLFFFVTAVLAQVPSMLRLLLAPTPDPRKFNAVGITVGIVTFLLLMLTQATMTRMALSLLQGEHTTIGEALKVGVRRYVPALGATILVTIAVVLASILLIVPGLIVAVMYAVAVPVCVLEAKGPITSLKRSGFLTKTMRWRVAGVYAIFLGLLYLVTYRPNTC